MSQLMSLADNKTRELWRSFMLLYKTIPQLPTSDLISLQVYEVGYFSDFDPASKFQKWAAVEMPESAQVPEGLEPFILPGGNYAVFDYKGPANDPGIFRYIFSTWLPASGYILDDRPHFEVLGDHYKNEDPDSEEEIWIPIKPR